MCLFKEARPGCWKIISLLTLVSIIRSHALYLSVANFHHSFPSSLARVVTREKTFALSPFHFLVASFALPRHFPICSLSLLRGSSQFPPPHNYIFSSLNTNFLLAHSSHISQSWPTLTLALVVQRESTEQLSMTPSAPTLVC